MDTLIYKQLDNGSKFSDLPVSEEKNSIEKANRTENVESLNEKCGDLNNSYCSALANNDPLNCGMCLRNLSRGYSEGDASLLMDASLLLESSQHDKSPANEKPLGVATRDTFIDRTTDELKQKQLSSYNNR